ncbi:hypothetical protein AZ34_06875 [Hylemonella gracilis str. Niagara R]|uniref:DUF2798 domain-containing protein n=1 Tax=Hylemonella gracilis str. Niagara R TaxID=1458275 RepID=A0A016XGV9_9BURK|nr:DUF2798 domain-containing protein [Hylemonella gracilis]EYC50817.1 hypothetical protein AZ34_06875 [Hylemonella gracilis str. Niagara R]
MQFPISLPLRKLPARHAGVVMPFFLSFMMSGIISFISILRGVGWRGLTLPGWLGAWGLSWAVAFPMVLLLLPVVRRLTARVVQMDRP